MQEDIAQDMSRNSDVFVFGRVTYEIFAAYWPTATDGRGIQLVDAHSAHRQSPTRSACMRHHPAADRARTAHSPRTPASRLVLTPASAS